MGFRKVIILFLKTNFSVFLPKLIKWELHWCTGVANVYKTIL